VQDGASSAAGSASDAAAFATQTGLDATATSADRVQTGLDRTATGADRVQTGLDRTATAADRVQTGLDAAATAADRVQTGADRVATGADRTSALASEVNALASKTAAGLSEVAAASSASTAQVAAATVGRYTSTAAGLAATTSGQTFWVYMSGGAQMDLYLNNAGSAVSQSFSMPSVGGVDAAFATHGIVNGSPRSKYTQGWRDAFGRVGFGLTRFGRLLFKGVDVTDNLDPSILTRLSTVETNVGLAASLRSGSPRSKYTHGWRDAFGRVGFGLTRDGQLLFKGVDLLSMFDTSLSARVTALEASMATVQASLKSSTSIVCWGDSLTEGAGSTGGLTYPAQLATLMSRTATNLGIGSQGSDQITARTGARAALLTMTGDQIPASGAVTVTAYSIDVCYYAGASKSVTGLLAGVPGTLTKVTSGGGNTSLVSYTFTRTTSGSIVTCLPGTAFVPDVVYPDRLHCIWIGRNDYSNVTDATALAAVNAKIETDIAAIVAKMSTLEKHFIIFGVTAKADVTEYVGTNNFNAKRDLAGHLARDYPLSFIDIDVILRRSGDGGATDNADAANGIIPSSLRSDTVHLVNAGYAIVAAAAQARINQNGW